MNLALITTEGIVITLIENLEEYDLRKPMAKAEVLETIEDELNRLYPERWTKKDWISGKYRTVNDDGSPKSKDVV